MAAYQFIHPADGGLMSQTNSTARHRHDPPMPMKTPTLSKTNLAVGTKTTFCFKTTITASHKHPQSTQHSSIPFTSKTNRTMASTTQSTFHLDTSSFEQTSRLPFNATTTTSAVPILHATITLTLTSISTITKTSSSTATPSESKSPAFSANSSVQSSTTLKVSPLSKSSLMPTTSSAPNSSFVTEDGAFNHDPILKANTVHATPTSSSRTNSTNHSQVITPLIAASFSEIASFQPPITMIVTQSPELSSGGFLASGSSTLPSLAITSSPVPISSPSQSQTDSESKSSRINTLVTSQSSDIISSHTLPLIFPSPTSSTNATEILKTTSKGFFHNPGMVAGTFVPVGLLLILIVWGIFACRRRTARHKYRRLLRSSGIDDHETARLNAAQWSHTNLSMATSEYHATPQFTSLRGCSEPEMEQIIASRPNSPHCPPNPSLTVPETAMSSLVTLQTTSNVEVSPVDPVDPFGPHRYSTQSPFTPVLDPFRTPRASINPQSMDPGAEASVMWMVANEIPIQTDHSFEPIADDTNYSSTQNPELDVKEGDVRAPQRKTTAMSWLEFASESCDSSSNLKM